MAFLNFFKKPPLIFLVLLTIVLLWISNKANAFSIINGNPNFDRNFPIFIKTIKEEFPHHAGRADYFAAQIEKESCASAKKCWNNRAQLFTYEDLKSGKRREYGFGLGQITITNRFNNFEELKKRDKRLANWDFEKRWDTRKQIIGLFVLNEQCWKKVNFAGTTTDRYAMTFACYNGGIGHIIKDRQLCINKQGCNPNLWFNNIELNSVKSKKVLKGYGESFFTINRKYPKEIMFKRNAKYKPYLKDLVKN